MTSTPAKTPNAAQISRLLKAAGLTKSGGLEPGFIVTQERGGRIDYNLNRSMGARFPLVLVRLPAADIARAVEILTTAGYHAEARDFSGLDSVRAQHTHRAVVVLSQDELDWNAGRAARTENADAEAEKLVPATATVRVRLTTYPDHSRRTSTTSRAQVLAMTAEALRMPETEILTADDISRECAADWDLFPYKNVMTGLRTTVKGHHATILLIPVESAPAPITAQQPSDDGTHLVSPESGERVEIPEGATASSAQGADPALPPYTLPEVEGATFTVTREGSRYAVVLREDGSDWRAEEWTYHAPAGVEATAAHLVRHLGEWQAKRAALDAFEDTTVYRVESGGDHLTLTGRETREHLATLRGIHGPMGVKHSGAFWVIHFPEVIGQDTRIAALRLIVQPVVTARATRDLLRGGYPVLGPTATPSSREFGPWVRPVPGHRDRVLVTCLTAGAVRRDAEPLAGYRDVLTGAGWVWIERTDDGDVYRAVKTRALEGPA
ncbi:hypothetical protein ACFZAM_31770 [Streptomyces sp. NPDC008079]|uniref:hypothetical protein n=1 Tax=Streptomyces sp. NPDC008079 TaxID=3364806 RepID=UPI0036EE626E